MKQYLEKRGIYITWSQLVMRIIFDLVGFLLALLPAGLTLYLTDVWITSGTHMPTSWILGIIVCVFLIHFYQFYFVNYNSQMNADRMAGNYRQHLAQKILSSSIPAYESQNKARIQNMANDVSAIYTVSSYLVTVPANLVKVIIIIGLLLFYASPSVALTAIILIPLYMVPSFLNKSELERLVAKEREAGDLWFQEFDVILNGKVSITLNKVENYMQNRYNEALKSYVYRAEQFAKGVEAAEEAVPGAQKEILSGKIRASDREISSIAKVPKEKRPEVVAELRKPKGERDSSITDSYSSPSKDNEFITTFKQDIQGHKKGLNKEEKQNLKDAVKSIYSPRRLADGEAMMCEIQGAQEDFVRRWEMCFREYPDILTEPKNNEKLLIFIDRASRYLQTVKDRLNNDGNQNSQTV